MERRAGLGFLEEPTDDPGIVQADGGSMFVVLPDGARVPLPGGGPTGATGPTGAVGPMGATGLAPWAVFGPIDNLPTGTRQPVPLLSRGSGGNPHIALDADTFRIFGTDGTQRLYLLVAQFTAVTGKVLSELSANRMPSNSDVMSSFGTGRSLPLVTYVALTNTAGVRLLASIDGNTLYGTVELLELGPG